MNLEQQIICHPNPDAALPQDFELPSGVKRVGEIIGALAVGAFSGYAFYWVIRGIDKLGSMYFKRPVDIFNPIPYVLSGLISAAIIETVRLTYDIGMKILGDREHYENLAHPEEESSISRLRQHTWKVISKAEKIPHDVDVVFSKILDIRTAKEIRETKIADRDLSTMEIARRALGEQVHETVTSVIPQELGIHIVEAMGYTLLGAQGFLLLNVIGFVGGIFQKMDQIRLNIMLEEIRELEQADRENENKMYCDFLAEMYPAEFAELDAKEQGLNQEQRVNPEPVLIQEEEILDVNVPEQAVQQPAAVQPQPAAVQPQQAAIQPQQGAERPAVKNLEMYVINCKQDALANGEPSKPKFIPFKDYPATHRHTAFHQYDNTWLPSNEGPELAIEEAINISEAELPANFLIVTDA